MKDPALSLAILGGCVVAGWCFFRWDQRMILRDRRALDEEITALERGRAERE